MTAPRRRSSDPIRCLRPVVAVTVAVSLVVTWSAASAGARARRVRVVAAAGDISPEDGRDDDDRVARMIRSTIDPDAVLAIGDEQYEEGTLADYRTYYADGWGARPLLRITYPVPGNHEYGVGPGETPSDPAAGYFRYFRRAAVDPNGVSRGAGYYSFNLGAWHVVALNSSTGDAPSRAQVQWMRGDLARNRRRCALAFWHHPRWSSGIEHGSDRYIQPLWRVAVDGGVDVVLSAHEHLYERFRRKEPHGKPVSDDSPRPAAREFVVGTGGKGGNEGFGRPLPGSQVRWPSAGAADVFGALKLSLAPGSYRWSMLDLSGAVVDSGGPVRCH
jgi:3',5'-cyclic AMP phosphodiesterase CpdA